MAYLTGPQIQKSELKNFIGKRIIYLFNRDIDKSGRGYYFPRTGVITSCKARTIEFDNNGDPKSMVDFREAVEATPENIESNFK